MGGLILIVYADVFFIENFIVNMFLLTITVKFLKHKCKVYRLLLSACIGGIYSFVLIVPKLNILGTMPFELITAYIMLRLVCGKTKFLSILKALIIFLMVTFTLSGLCFLISLKQNYYVLGGIFKIEKYSIKYAPSNPSFVKEKLDIS